MAEQRSEEAWIALPSEEKMRSRIPSGVSHPYDFGFLGPMTRLVAAHDTIGPIFGRLFREIMFAPGQLDRREREMVAAVAAAAQDCHY